MAVKDLQIVSRLLGREARMPRLGKLKKGSAKVNGQMGRDLKDRFRFDTTDAEALAAFEAAFPTGNHIRVLLPYVHLAENWSVWRELHGTNGRLKIQCTGPSDEGAGQIVRWETKEGAMYDMRRPNRLPPEGHAPECYAPQCQCRERGRLIVIIPELYRLEPVVLETTSKYDNTRLTENLLAVELLVAGNETGMKYLPLVLYRAPEKVMKPEFKGKEATGKFIMAEEWLIHIKPDPRFVAQRMLEVQRSYGALPSPAIAALPPPSAASSAWEVDEEDEEDEVPPEENFNMGPSTRELLLSQINDTGLAQFGNDEAVWKKKCEASVAQRTDGATEDINQLTDRQLEEMLAALYELRKKTAQK